jgi:hypothetical protein
MQALSPLHAPLAARGAAAARVSRARGGATAQPSRGVAPARAACSPLAVLSAAGAPEPARHVAAPRIATARAASASARRGPAPCAAAAVVAAAGDAKDESPSPMCAPTPRALHARTRALSAREAVGARGALARTSGL